MERKVCSKCKEEKEVCEFTKDSTRKDGYFPQCGDTLTPKNQKR
jgi:hypothetical protein